MSAAERDPLEMLDALRAERDALLARAEEAERVAEELAEELGAARATLAREPDPEPEPEPEAADPTTLSLFDGTEPEPSPPRPPGAGEPVLLPLTLAALATVALVAGLASWASLGFFSPFTLAMLSAGVGLARVAWLSRVVRAEVTVEDGVVTVVQGEATYSFDLRAETTRLEVQGRPGDPDWRVRFYRRGLDPVDVDARMVDPATFQDRLREYRPGL